MLFANTHTHIYIYISIERIIIMGLYKHIIKCHETQGGDTFPPYMGRGVSPSPAFPALSFRTVCVTNIMLYIPVYSMGCKCDVLCFETWGGCFETRKGNH